MPYRLIIFIILSIPTILLSYSGPYYVATNGSDASSGSNTMPLATIQTAINWMSAGPPVCTSATCFIGPGVYNQNMIISANNNSNFMVLRALTPGNKPVLQGESMDHFAIKITNTGRVIVSNLNITAFTYGVILSGSSSNNRIVANYLYSQTNFGIFLFSGNADNNIIENNQIYQTLSGIVLSDGDNNNIKNNNIYQCSNGIVFSGNASSNQVSSNQIYSMSNGVLFLNDASISNRLIANQIRDSATGLFLLDSDYNGFYKNRFTRLSGSAIILSGNATGNLFENNTITSNRTNGIYFQGDAVDDNTIISNQIFYNYRGIFINDGDNNKIYRNLVRNNTNGIYLTNTSQGIQIINNTFFSNFKNSIWISGSTTADIYNNIIQANGNYSNTYGINDSSSGTVDVAYNDFYGNKFGFTNGSVSWGAGNVFDYPMINTAFTFEITNVVSPAVDSGTNIPGVTDYTQGGGPDMGWKESSYFLIIPSGPQILTIRVMAYSNVEIVWRNMTNESSYTLYRNTTPSTGSALILSGFSMNVTNYSDYPLKPETTYYYWIKAYNRLGESSFSPAFPVTTPSIYYSLEFNIFPTAFHPATDGLAMIYLGEDKPEVSIKIYNIAGRVIKQWDRVTGEKFIYWDGKDEKGQNIRSGMYIVHIRGEGINYQAKMILTR
ncbi:MAG: right-handed parallel beta-helix repeat-containing protein [Spirochaetes bacterium]|nr:right-handed parallel beta-helix repeat-containing protein [Spirochaetota bacterium]